MRAEYRALLVGVERVGGVVGSVMRAEYRALFVSVLFLRMRRQAGMRGVPADCRAVAACSYGAQWNPAGWRRRFRCS